MSQRKAFPYDSNEIKEKSEGKTAQQSDYLDGLTNENPNAQSLTTDLRMDPNYKWLLKDLNLSNKSDSST